MTEAQKQQLLRTLLPLTIEYEFGSTQLDQLDNSSFTISVNWEYENSFYYKVPSVFTYSDDVTYYTISGGTYNEATVTSANYDSLKNSLYLAKDDIDSYIGEKCGIYQNTNDTSCLILKGELVAEQSQAGS